MFMVKGEYANIKNLVKVKIKTRRKNITGLFVTTAFMSLGSLAVTVFGIMNHAGVLHYNVTDFSSAFFFGVIAIIADNGFIIVPIPISKTVWVVSIIKIF